MPLDPGLRAALERLPRLGRKAFRFLTPDGKPICLVTASARVREPARLAGVKLTMESLRRGFGCRLAGRVPARVLQRLMRHASIKTTMDDYVNIDDAVEEAILGPKRNRLRNSRPPASGVSEGPEDATWLDEKGSDES